MSDWREGVWAHVNQRADSHWVWTGAAPRGKPQWAVPRRNDLRSVNARRLVWALVRGDEPGPYLVVQCSERLCVNPDHAREVEHWTEAAAPKTHCIHGHEMTEENTFMASANGKPRPQCRTCRREISRRQWAKRQASTLS